jgi:hypothetical protein
VLAVVPPAHYQARTTVVKYDGKTNSSVWLEDYRSPATTEGRGTTFSS